MINVATPHQRSFPLKQTEIITENHSRTQCKDQWIMGNVALRNTSASQMVHLWHGEHNRRAQGKIKRPRIPGNMIENSLS